MTRIGAFLVFLVLAGVFFPTFSRQIIDGHLVSAILIVLVVWFVQYRVRVRPKDPGVAVSKPAREASPPPSGGAESPPGPAEGRTDTDDADEKKGDRDQGGANHA